MYLDNCIRKKKTEKIEDKREEAEEEKDLAHEVHNIRLMAWWKLEM